MKNSFAAALLVVGLFSTVVSVYLVVSGIANPSAASGTLILCSSHSTINGKNVCCGRLPVGKAKPVGRVGAGAPARRTPDWNCFPPWAL